MVALSKSPSRLCVRREQHRLVAWQELGPAMGRLLHRGVQRRQRRGLAAGGGHAHQATAGVGGEHDRAIAAPRRAPAAVDLGDRQRCAARGRHFAHLGGGDKADPLAVGREERVVGLAVVVAKREDRAVQLVELPHAQLAFALAAADKRDVRPAGGDVECGAEIAVELLGGQPHFDPELLNRRGPRPQQPRRGRRDQHACRHAGGDLSQHRGARTGPAVEPAVPPRERPSAETRCARAGGR